MGVSVAVVAALASAPAPRVAFIVQTQAILIPLAVLAVLAVALLSFDGGGLGARRALERWDGQLLSWIRWRACDRNKRLGDVVVG